MTLVRRGFIGLSAALALFAAGCSGSSDSGARTSGGAAPSSQAGSSTATGSSAPVGTAPASSSGNLYVSIGDSYAAGYQPTGTGHGRTTRNGFAYQLVRDAVTKGYHLQLQNFACAGATTTSTLKTPGCDAQLLGPGATGYPGRTQAAAAEAYLRAHRGKVALITVSIGGNDVTKCSAARNAVACVSPAVSLLKTNLTTLVKGLRAAAGPSPKIVGITYPDVLLGAALSKDPAKQQLAKLSVLAFQSLINPALRSIYRSVGGAFVDVTAATGGYGPLTATTVLPPFGRIPAPVAKICRLTYYCQYQDIHPRTNGYALIARLIAATLPKR